MSVKQDKQTKKWYCRVSYKDDDGKYKQITRKNFDTKTEARLKESEIKKKVKDGSFFIGKSISFGDYFEKWIDNFVSNSFSVGSKKRYKYDLKLVKSYFGNKPISKITRKDYQNFLNFRGEGKTLDTVSLTHNHLKRCLQDAIYDGLIEKDPTYKIVLNYDKDDKPEHKKYLSKDEAQKLLDYVITHFPEFPQSYLMIIIGLATGMRYGEILALSWKDIDFKNMTININKGFDYIYTQEFTKGKTMSSKRIITVDNQTMTYMKRVKLMFPGNYLFLDKFKDPFVSHNALNKHLKNICKRLDIKIVTFHSLRHTHASILIYRGVDINYVSKRLGHKNIAVTLKTYTHVIKELETKENTKVTNLLESMLGN